MHKHTRILLSLFLTLITSLSYAQYTATEQTVSFERNNQTIMATLTQPDAPGTYPAVLILHGFTGQRDELPVAATNETMFGRTARILAENGITSLRIDFIGSGESDGLWQNTTFSSQIKDATTALEFLSTTAGVHPERIAVLGLSQGGLIASALAARAPVKTTVLWSPVANPVATYSALLGTEAINEALSSDTLVTASLSWGGETTLHSDFFKELFTIDPVSDISTYHKPLLVIVGSRDDVVTPQPQYGQLYLTYHEGLEQLVVLDADHLFDILGTGPGRLDDAIMHTLNWLKTTL